MTLWVPVSPEQHRAAELEILELLTALSLLEESRVGLKSNSVCSLNSISHKLGLLFSTYMQLTHSNSPWMISHMSWLVLPATFLAVHVYTPASLRWIEVIAKVPLEKIRTWELSITGLLSLCQMISGCGCPSAAHSRLMGRPSTAVYSVCGALRTGGTGELYQTEVISLTHLDPDNMMSQIRGENIFFWHFLGTFDSYYVRHNCPVTNLALVHAQTLFCMHKVW